MMTMAAPKTKSIRSNDKTIVERNQKEIIGSFEPWGGKSRKKMFVETMDSLKKHSGSRPISTQQAMERIVNGGAMDVTYYQRAKYLNKVGLKKYDAEKIDDLTDKQLEEVNNTYVNLMVRDGTKLYDQIKNDTRKPAAAKKPAMKAGSAKRK